MKLTREIPDYRLIPEIPIYEVRAVVVEMDGCYAKIPQLPWGDLQRTREESLVANGGKHPLGRPTWFAVTPDFAWIAFDPVPDEDYLVRLRYVSLHEL